VFRNDRLAYHPPDPQQTEIGRRQGGKGTGLGLGEPRPNCLPITTQLTLALLFVLALCMQIVKLMGGRMGVDSQLGVGSTFW